MTEIYRLDRSIIKVTGPDAVRFLDNLLTQDVTKLKRAGLLYSALLTPQGKVVADMLLWDRPDGVLIASPPSRRDELWRKLSMYKLRAAAALEDVSDQWAVSWSPLPFQGAITEPRLPAGALGWVSFGPARDAPPADAGRYDEQLLRLGMPDLSRDASPEEVFGLEALLEELHGVDFAKGCFVGQENVSRMKRRATTRKKFCPIGFSGNPPAPLTPIVAGAAEIGSVRSGMQGRAMALIRLDRAQQAIAAAIPLMANGVAVTLDPPSWLILPAPES